jgi:fructose-1,6-bisphosphatase/inositol monophosphatase family enzyme
VATRTANISTDRLVESAISAVQDCQETIAAALERLERKPESVAERFQKVLRNAGRVDAKDALAIDLDAESASKAYFLRMFPSQVQVLGEETLTSFKKWQDEQYCVLLDMVDGTDLVEMGLNLWCSAVVIFDRVNAKILGSVVGLPSGHIYHAREGQEGGRVRIEGEDYLLEGCSNITAIKHARIAFYGQKAKNFMSVAGNAGFRRALTQVEKDTNATCRVYDFAGNPMMVKLANRKKDDVGVSIVGDIDAVFDLLGQQMHDVVPGAYIAKKAGAFMCDIQGDELTFEELGRRMTNPKDKLNYVLAATEALAKELAGVLAS